MLRDLRLAARTLRRSPGFTLAAVLTLALGIGATTAIFSVVNGVLLRPLPYAAPERLVVAWTDLPSFGKEVASLPDFVDWRSRNRVFASLGAGTDTKFNLTGEGEPERIPGAAVTTDFLPTLGVAPVVGRGFSPDEERGVHRVAILGHGFWERRFGGAPDVLGRTIMLSERPYTVIGVAPAGLRIFPEEVDAWIPLRTDSANGRRADFLTVIGRLKPGITETQAQDDMSRIAAALGEEYPGTNTGVGVDVVPLMDEVVGKVRPALLVFMGAVGLVLLIACANVANLMLARAAAREREVAIRATLGAGRRQLLRPLLAESLLVALLGGATGLFLAFWSLELLRAAQPTFLPRLDDIGLDARVLGVTLVLTLFTGVLFTIVPAMRLLRGELNETLREGTRGGSGGAAAQRMRSTLVLAEVATALVLLTGAGLLLRSFDQLQRVDAGFDSERVLSLQVILPSARYGGEANIDRRRNFTEQLAEQARAVPGVQLAAVSSTLPTAGTPYTTFFIAGRPMPEPGTNQDVQNFAASPDYFRLMGIRLVRGRLFTAQDDGSAPGVVVINESMARRYWPDADPLGARVSYGDPTDSTTSFFTVVGVVADVKQEGLGSDSYAQWYQPLAQRPVSGLYLTVKTAADPLAVAGALRRVVAAVDPNLPVSDIQTMEQRVGTSIAQPRMSVALLGGFSAIALLLAAVGIYGVMSYAVAQRTREIGIRMALGARPGDVRRLIVFQGMLPVALGVGMGMVGALAATRLMRSLLFGVSATDPLTFVAMAAFLTVVALLASYLPARRATRVDPLIAMRSE